ncbi:MAG: hypothetical protein ACFFAO_06560 [Candidatus Hermodarchaeota archaeon]
MKEFIVIFGFEYDETKMDQFKAMQEIFWEKAKEVEEMKKMFRTAFHRELYDTNLENSRKWEKFMELINND